MNMIIQDDTFLSYNEQTNFKDFLLRESLWVFNPSTNIPTLNGESLGSSNDSFQFVHRVDIGDSTYEAIMAVFKTFASKHKITVNHVGRIKSNITTRRDNAGHHAPHVDQDFPHKVFLYYVNDADGDTIFFNEFWEGFIPSQLTEQTRIPPKMGKGVVFDGLQYHASTSPQTANYRCVINIDFV